MFYDWFNLIKRDISTLILVLVALKDFNSLTTCKDLVCANFCGCDPSTMCDVFFVLLVILHDWGSFYRNSTCMTQFKDYASYNDIIKINDA